MGWPYEALRSRRHAAMDLRTARDAFPALDLAGIVVAAALLVWAFAGIAVSQAETPIVVWAAWIGCALLLGVGLFVLTRGPGRQRGV